MARRSGQLRAATGLCVRTGRRARFAGPLFYIGSKIFLCRIRFCHADHARHCGLFFFLLKKILAMLIEIFEIFARHGFFFTSTRLQIATWQRRDRTHAPAVRRAPTRDSRRRHAGRPALAICLTRRDRSFRASRASRARRCVTQKASSTQLL